MTWSFTDEVSTGRVSCRNSAPDPCLRPECLGLRLASSVIVAGRGPGRGHPACAAGGTACRGEVDLQRTKDRKEPAYPRAPRLRGGALRRHKDRQSFEAASTPRWKDQGLVFPNTYGGPLDPRNALTRFRKTLAAAGLPEQRFHDLLHYAATFMVAKGVPLRVVMDILGIRRWRPPPTSTPTSCRPRTGTWRT